METTKLYYGSMPDVAGYGISVIHNDRDVVVKRMKFAYKKWKKAYKLPWSFEGAFEYFGATIKEIEIGKIYYDEFKE